LDATADRRFGQEVSSSSLGRLFIGINRDKKSHHENARLIIMQKIAEKGWIFEVESSAGMHLYAIRCSSPLEAEDILREKLKLDDSVDVFPFQPLPIDDLLDFNLAEGEIKGPM
jgi:hypothetical protein